MLKKVSFAAIVLVMFFAAYYFSTSDPEYQSLKKQLQSTQILANPEKPMIDFSLLDHNKQVFDNSRLKGKWTLLFFGYTHCPDICPTALMSIAAVTKALKKNNAKITPNVVFVTFDPERDTPEVLSSYVTYFNKDFLGVSGDQTQINSLVDFFGAYYERVMYLGDKAMPLDKDKPVPKQAMENGYIINHTAWFYLIDPQGQIFAGFPSPHHTKKMADDIKVIVEAL